MSFNKWLPITFEVLPPNSNRGHKSPACTPIGHQPQSLIFKFGAHFNRSIDEDSQVEISISSRDQPAIIETKIERRTDGQTDSQSQIDPRMNLDFSIRLVWHPLRSAYIVQPGRAVLVIYDWSFV